jgi:hypothetical protein
LRNKDGGLKSVHTLGLVGLVHGTWTEEPPDPVGQNANLDTEFNVF